MNPPPALVAAFVARLDRVLEHLRAELRPGDVLVYRSPFASIRPGALAPPAAQLFTFERGRGRVPGPLTVAEALATVTAARDDLAAAFAAELAHAVAAVVPVEHQAGALEDPAVIAAWPVRNAATPGFTESADLRADVSPAGPVEALSHLLERVPTLPGDSFHTDHALFGTDHALFGRHSLPEVARWAHQAGGGRDGSDGVYLGVAHLDNARLYNAPPSFPGVGLTVLYRHLWAGSPLFAAREAGRIIGDLVSDEGNRAWLAAVDAVLAPVDGSPDALADVARADVARRGGFAGALVAAARTVAARVFTDPPPVDDDAARELTGSPPALLWDRRFAAELDRLGGARAPDVLALAVERARTSGADLWHLWAPIDGPPRWLRALARELWLSLWRPALARERRPVGLYRGGLVTILRSLDARTVEPDGRIIGALGTATGRVGALTVNADALRGMGRGPSLRRALDVTLAVRFVPWFASLVQRRETEPDWVHLEAADGLTVWGAMVASVGLAVNEVRVAAMKRAVKALAGQIVTLDGGIEVSLFDGYRYDPGGGRGNRARLALNPGPPWWSRTVGPWSGEYAYLAPIPVLDGWLPPLYGRDNEHAALARFWFLFLSELAEQAPRIVTHGAALFPPGRAASLALEAAVKTPPPLLIEKQLSMWKEAEIIEEVETNCYNLHPRFAAERDVLVEGGARRIGAKEDGQHGAAVRAALRKGETPPPRKIKRKPPPT